MKNTFLKNFHQILIFAISELIIIIPIICMLFMMNKSGQNNYKLICIYIILLLIILYICIGFYWIFQFVRIDSNGITIMFFKRVLREIKWKDVEIIEFGLVMRHPALIVKVKEGKKINLDYRKQIVKLIEAHLPFDKIEIPKK